MAIPSCVKEELSEESVFVSDQETFVTVDFNITDYEEIAITTKSTLDLVPESRVQNLFVYIFVDGKRVYAHYFDKSNAYARCDIDTYVSVYKSVSGEHRPPHIYD